MRPPLGFVPLAFSGGKLQLEVESYSRGNITVTVIEKLPVRPPAIDGMVRLAITYPDGRVAALGLDLSRAELLRLLDLVPHDA
jgi:hypothetical protein